MLNTSFRAILSLLISFSMYYLRCTLKYFCKEYTIRYLPIVFRFINVSPNLRYIRLVPLVALTLDKDYVTRPI